MWERPPSLDDLAPIGDAVGGTVTFVLWLWRGPNRHLIWSFLSGVGGIVVRTLLTTAKKEDGLIIVLLLAIVGIFASGEDGIGAAILQAIFFRTAFYWVVVEF